MLRITKNDAFSLIEVIITVVVAGIAFLGIYTTISVFRPQSSELNEKLEASHAALNVYHSLLSLVDSRTYYNADGALGEGEHWQIVGAFNVAYNVTDNPDETKRIDISVSKIP